MKKIFIYYSHTGNGDLLAKTFEEKGYDVRKVTPKKPLAKSFFFSVLKGGMLAGMNHKSKLKDYDNDVSSYDEVVIGSPIWNGKLSCPINTVLAETNLEGKKLSFVLYSGSGESPKATKMLKAKYQCEIVDIKEPKKYFENVNKLSNF